jgi:hypothetical protein
MELKEFLTQTLVQISEGVQEAQKQVKDSGCIINPLTDHKGTQIQEEYQNNFRQIQTVKMSIAVSVTESNDTKAGIGIVASIIQAGKSNGESEQNQTINRIEFEIPVALPVMGK